MKPTIELDARQWQAAVRELFQTSSRTMVDFTNGQALKVAVESVRQTYKANRAEIAHTLGAVGQEVSFRTITRGPKTGSIRLKKGNLLAREDSFAARILGARFKSTGKWGVGGETMKERVHNLISSRMRAAGFIASGWIAARNVLWSVVRRKPARSLNVQGVRQFGRSKGSARPARFSLRSNIEAMIVNTALQGNVSNPPATGGNPMQVATYGLSAALRVAAQDMIAELARRLHPDFKKVSAR